MRSVAVDSTGFITFSASLTSAASGSGVAVPGVQYVFTNSSSTYTVNFDPGLVPVSVVAVIRGTGRAVDVTSTAAGQIVFNTFNPSTLAADSNHFFFVCVAKDNRV